MRKLLFFLLFIPGLCFAETPQDILGDVYGAINSSCIQKQIATTGNNRLGTAMTAGRRYIVYCHDGSGAGVACECLQGGSTVDVSSTTSFTLFAGEKIVIHVNSANTQLSCQSLAGTPYVDACPLGR